MENKFLLRCISTSSYIRHAWKFIISIDSNLCEGEWNIIASISRTFFGSTSHTGTFIPSCWQP